MAARSPNYPSLSLAQAIEGIKKVHKEDTVSKVSREAVAKHLGYQVLSGPSTQKIAAIRAYGLLEGSGDELRVSGDAVTIIADPVTSDERQQAIRKSAFRPKLFSEINEYFEGARPSEENLRSYLLKKSFRTDTASKAVGSYLETFDLVSREGGAYDSLHKHAGNKSAIGMVVEKNEAFPVHVVRSDSRQRLQRERKPGMKEDVFTLDEGDVVFQWPGSLSKESYEDLESWMEIQLRKIKRRIVIAEDIPTTPVEPMATKYTDDEEGREAENLDSERDEIMREIDPDLEEMMK